QASPALNALPSWRKRACGRRQMSPQCPPEFVPQFLQTLAPAVQHPVLAFESHQQADIHQAEKGEMLCRLFGCSVEDVEDLFAAPCFIVKLVQKAVVAPRATAAPWRRHDGFIDHRAESVTSGADIGAADLRSNRALFETPELIDHLVAQRIDVGVLDGVAQL